MCTPRVPRTILGVWDPSLGAGWGVQNCLLWFFAIGADGRFDDPLKYLQLETFSFPAEVETVLGRKELMVKRLLVEAAFSSSLAEPAHKVLRAGARFVFEIQRQRGIGILLSY